MARDIVRPHRQKPQELMGQRFDRMVIVEYLGCINHSPYMRCRCDCGELKDVRLADLRKRRVKSCGCLRKEVTGNLLKTHGQSNSPEYQVWLGMKARCHYPKHIDYPWYGARGITVCERWRESFEAFLADMGPRPGRGYELDRINNEGRYEPGNVRWVTRIVNARNKRNNRFLTYKGETLPLAVWAERLQMPRRLLYDRLWWGWDHDRIIETPAPKRE